MYILPSNLISFPLPHVFQLEIFPKRIFYFWLGAEACSEDFRRDGKVKIFIIVTQATRLVGISEGMCPSLEGIIPFLKIQILTSTSIWIFRKVMIRSIWSIKDAVYTLTIWPSGYLGRRPLPWGWGAGGWRAPSPRDPVARGQSLSQTPSTGQNIVIH